MRAWSKGLSWFLSFFFNVNDVTGYMFGNENDVEERENDDTGEGIISEAMYLRNGMGSVHK